LIEWAVHFVSKNQDERKTGLPSAPAPSVLASLPRLRDVRIHPLRHSFASLAVSGGALQNYTHRKECTYSITKGKLK
jgi:hypothetical protein